MARTQKSFVMRTKVMKRNLIFFGLVSCLLLFLSGCTNQTIYKEFKEMETFTWQRFNFLEFEVTIKETDPVYDISLVFRHLPELKIKQLPINIAC